ncbi:uncharacterized protein SCHCODRAFT_02492533 [Schizophyllum commune H4-8]|nr:uncharacterized protein SCHCODRAFT_02492533 [Schizophyllum commune H4-8]KAI5896178.1 hypothetical protein SCHCODRAFT_02492533 [Schizophyllum commune H4-8]
MASSSIWKDDEILRHFDIEEVKKLFRPQSQAYAKPKTDVFLEQYKRRKADQSLPPQTDAERELIEKTGLPLAHLNEHNIRHLFAPKDDPPGGCPSASQNRRAGLNQDPAVISPHRGSDTSMETWIQNLTYDDIASLFTARTSKPKPVLGNALQLSQTTDPNPAAPLRPFNVSGPSAKAPELSLEGLDMKTCIADFVRRLLREALHINNLKDAWKQPSCSQERLAAYRQDTVAAGPNLTEGPIRLDTSAGTLLHMKWSPWNLDVISLLARKARCDAERHLILRHCKELDVIDWEGLCRDRVHTILGDCHRGRPRSETESPELAQQRMDLSYAKNALLSSKRRIRAWKYDVRCSIAAGMLQSGQALSQGRNPDIAANAKDQTMWWAEACAALHLLTEDGMSDEEDGYDGDEQVRVVQDIRYRSLRLRNFLATVDEARIAEKLIFPMIGRSRRRRVYVSSMVDREPPRGLPLAFYKGEFLRERGSYAESRLAINYEDDNWRILEQ